MSKCYADQFLIPLPARERSYFDGTLIYICDHTEEGAFGLVVNRMTGIGLNELLKAMDLKHDFDSSPAIFNGGPVSESTPTVLHSDDYSVESSLAFKNAPGLALTNPLANISEFTTLLTHIAEDKGPSKYLIALGYSGWSEGQLDREINANIWLTSSGSQEIIFDAPVENRVDLVADQIGIDLTLLSGSNDGMA